MSYLEFQSISKMYDKNVVLSDVSFQVSKGEVFGIFGPNGSGKTTLLKILCGLTPANSGKITLENQVLRTDSVNYKRFIGAVFVDVQPFENVTCFDLLVFFGKFYGKNDSEIKTKLNELKKTFQMDFLDKKIAMLSTGMKQKILISLAFIHNPNIIILDEASNGLDLLTKKQLFQYVELQKTQGKTIIFASHIVSEISQICDKMIVLQQGKTRISDKINQTLIKRDSLVLEEELVDLVGDYE